MAMREFDPCRLDVEAFAAAAGRLEGRWPLARFARLIDSAKPGLPESETGDVLWHVRGERRRVQGGETQTWLHVRATTRLPLECQRCLEAVGVPLEVERSFRFVSGEDAAAELDAHSDEDVLATTRALDLRELIEDELLLALPLVPRHEQCPEPLRAAGEDLAAAEPAPNPFAVLAALRRSGPLN